MKVINIKKGFSPRGIEWKGENQLKSSIFPGGEIFVRLDDVDIRGEDVLITTRLNTSDDIMELIMVTDAIRRLNPDSISVYFPYLPYARQDRVCNEGESFSLKVFGNLINSQNYKSVTVFDVHSNVAGACIDNLSVEHNLGYVGRMVRYHYGYNGRRLSEVPDMNNVILISPDSGALKKIYDVAKHCKFNDIAIGEKVRNLETTEIIKTDINRQDFEGKDCWIVDDVCDGGKTFIELAQVLRERNAGKIILFVTHGIFSKGFEPLSNYLDYVYFTNSINDQPLIETEINNCKFIQTEI